MSAQVRHGCWYGLGACALVVACASQPRPDVNGSAETATRVQIAASTLEDTVVIDCQLPGKLQKLGGMQTYLTPGRLVRATTLDCRTRGGEYTLGDLSSGTLSLKRWQPLAEKGDAESQYYVARIYANGMSGVEVDYAQAAHWYQLAANQSYKPAMQELGYLYEEGLGVERNLQLGLNLQRQASGLGDDLDYAWKITEARETAARQIDALSHQLEDSNGSLQDARAELLVEQNALARSRAEYRKSQDVVLDLRGRLANAKQATGAQDAAHVKELETKLAVNETALKGDAERIAQISSDLAARQSELDASLAKSQAMSLQLNEVIASRQSDQKAAQGVTDSLRARLAQTEQRLINSEQELSKTRVAYQRDVQRAVQEREDFDHARAKTTNDAAALIAAKQAELDRDQLRIQALESDLAAAKKVASTAAGAGAAAGAAQAQAATAGVAQAQAQTVAANARNAELTRTLADLRARYDDAQKQLAAEKQQLALEESKTTTDRTQVATQVRQQMAQQLAMRDADLAARQRHLDSLTYETNQLRGELKMLQDERDRETARRSGEERVLRQELSATREQATAQQADLEKARTDYAREQSDLLQLHTQLDQQRTQGQQNAQTIARLNAEVEEHESQLKAKDKYIAALLKQMDEHPVTLADTGLRTRSPGPAGAPPPPRPEGPQAKLLEVARTYDVEHPGRRYALLIGNSNYGNMNSLQTPLNDVRDIATVLENNYDFVVSVVQDASRTEIMLRLDQAAKSLKENDSLLVYFAGHGDRQVGPPERAFWLGVEADPKSKDGYLEVGMLQEQIKRMSAKHILLVADACFSGAIMHGRSVPQVREVTGDELKRKMDRRARMVLTAGGDTPVVDSSNDPDHSLFATYFIQTLRENRNLMSGEMLAHELDQRMRPEAAKLHVKEEPTYATMSDANHDFGDFYFLPKPVLVAAADSY
jgi:chromosome segregation ATPase